MHQIMPHPLWVGHAGSGLDFQPIFDAGIEALIQLAAEEPPSLPPREVICCRIPLVDGGGNREQVLRLAIGTVASLLRLRLPTLVYCGAGLSRAPAIAAAALSLVQGMPPALCLERIAEHHHTDVSTALWHDIMTLLPSLQAPPV
jgi:protein-tyrosine phosphatase